MDNFVLRRTLTKIKGPELRKIQFSVSDFSLKLLDYFIKNLAHMIFVYFKQCQNL